jgi:FtsP/CotA-like multicopper oxidase with cupredoxin domain
VRRRNFLKITTGALASTLTGATSYLLWQPRAHAATIEKTFYITDGYIQQADGTNVYFKGFSNSSGSLNVPGDALVAQEGDTIRIRLINTLGTTQNFSVQGHGVSVSLSGGNQRTIEFTARNPGSYLYYDNYNAPYNRLVGLHGGLAVMPRGSDDELYEGSPRFVQQKFWVFHDIDPIWHSRIRDRRTPSTTYTPRYFTLNGLGGRPPGAPGNGDPTVDAMHDHRSALHGHIGDRTLIRMLNPGMCTHSVHTHGNHMEWLTRNGQIRSDVWLKDCIYLPANNGRIDAIYPFDVPPDSWPRATTGVYPMHLHDEMTQTSGGGLYMFGAMTDIFFE